jgi:hypothetical protein
MTFIADMMGLSMRQMSYKPGMWRQQLF